MYRVTSSKPHLLWTASAGSDEDGDEFKGMGVIRLPPADAGDATRAGRAVGRESESRLMGHTFGVGLRAPSVGEVSNHFIEAKKALEEIGRQRPLPMLFDNGGCRALHKGKGWSKGWSKEEERVYDIFGLVDYYRMVFKLAVWQPLATIRSMPADGHTQWFFFQKCPSGEEWWHQQMKWDDDQPNMFPSSVRDGTHQLINFEGATHSLLVPAVGGEGWFGRRARVYSLPELFVHLKDKFTAADIVYMFNQLPDVVGKRRSQKSTKGKKQPQQQERQQGPPLPPPPLPPPPPPPPMPPTPPWRPTKRPLRSPSIGPSWARNDRTPSPSPVTLVPAPKRPRLRLTARRSKDHVVDDGYVSLSSEFSTVEESGESECGVTSAAASAVGDASSEVTSAAASAVGDASSEV